MEPPPPPAFFHGSNNQNNRYVPISPPRFSGDRNFYHPHPHPHPHPHHPHHLPPPPLPPPPRPPPALPPPPPPYHRPSQFSFPNSRPIEDDPRRHVFDIDRPPRVSDRVIFDHHHPPPFREDHPRLRGPDYNPEIWEPPRVPPDNRPPPRPRAFPVDWEHEPRHHPLIHPMSPCRVPPNGNFIDRKRFVEDPEGRPPPRDYPIDGFKRNQNQDFFLDQSVHRVSSSDKSHGNYFGHRIEFQPNASPRNFAPATATTSVSENHGSYHGFESDNGRLWINRGAGDGADEDRRWNSRPTSRDAGSFAQKPTNFHHSAIEMGNTEILCDDDIRIVSGKRFPHTLKMGKFNNRVGMEGAQEILHTAKKKPQKPSALLRVQLENPTYRKRKDDQLHSSSAYFNDPNSGSFRGPLVFSDHKLEEDREGSPVELDVSFKSNALVAKAIMAPSSPVVGYDGTCTPKNKKMKKITVPVSFSSSSRVTEFHEGPLGGDSSAHGVDATLSSDKGPKQLEGKLTVSSNRATDHVGLQPCTNGVNVSLGNSALEVSPSAITSVKGRVNVGRNGICTPKTKKQSKAMALLSGLSSSQVSGIHKGPINVGNTAHGADATLSPDKGKLQSEEKISVSGVGAMDNVGLQPCLNKPTVWLGNNAAQGSSVAMVSVKHDINVISDGTCTPKIKKNKKGMVPCSSMSNSRVSEIHEGPINVNTDSSTHYVDVNSDSANGPMHLEERATVSADVPADDIGSHPCPNGAAVLPESSALEGSPEAMIKARGGANVGLDGTCTPNSKKKRKFMSPLSGLLTSQVFEIREGPVNGDSLTHCADAASTLDKVPMHSEEKITASETGTVDDVGAQSCAQEVGVSFENNAVEGSPGAKDSVKGVLNFGSDLMCARKTKRKRKVRVPEIREGSTSTNCSSHVADSTSRSNKASTRSVEKSTNFGIESVDNVGPLPCPNGVTVLLENSAVKRSPKAVGSVRNVLNVSYDGLCARKSKSKKKVIAPLLDVPSSQASEIHGGPINADISTHGLDAPSSSDTVLMQPEEKVMVCGIGHLDNVDLQTCPNGVAVLLEDSAVRVSPKAVNSVRGGHKEDITKLQCRNVDSSSFVEVSVVLDLKSPCPSRWGGSQEDTTPVVATTKCQECPLQDDINKESGRKRKQKVDESELHSILGCENKEDISVLHPQTQEQPGVVPIELQTSDLYQRLSTMAVEGYACSHLVRDEGPSASNCLSLKAEASRVFMTNCNEGMGSVLDRLSKIDSSESLSMVPELHTLNVEQSLGHLSNEKICGDNNKPDENATVRDDSFLAANNSCTLEPEISGRSDRRMRNERSLPDKTVSLLSQEIKQPSSNLKLTTGELNRKKIPQTSGVPRAFQGQSSFISGHLKETAPSTRIANPRTWRRTDNTSASLAGKKSCSGTSLLQRLSPKKFGKVQSTSYIRKGNSLVRKGAPNAAFPQGSHGLSTAVYRLNPVARDETKNSTASECKVNSIDLLNCSKTGGMNASFESRKTPLLLHNKVSNSTTKSSQDCMYSTLADPLSEVGSETTPDPTKLTEIKDAPKLARSCENQASMSNNSGIQDFLNDGNSKSSKIKRVVYVKRKSNQLVASSSPGSRDLPVHVPEKTEALPPSRSSDWYYKKYKNQLIRNVPSPGTVVRNAVSIPDDSSNSEGQRVSVVSSLKCSRNLSKRRPDKVLQKPCKSSRFSFVWTLRGTHSQNGDKKALQCQKVLPYLFPWKRTAYGRNFMYNTASISNKGSFSPIRKLLLSRKRDTVYTRSTGGFSLRKSKVLSIGGSNLKWSKSIEKRSKKVNEEATLAVAAAQRKKREQKGAACAIAGARNRNQSSRKLGHSIELRPGERIFRIGSVRYKMDSSKRTLQRIADEKSSSTVDPQSGKDTKKSFVPRRLLIGNDEYVRIGNGNQLIRDPKKRIRILASEKIRWSLHTARLRLAKKQQYCQFFTRFGKCNKCGGKCPYIHDPTKVAICTKFLKGSCSNIDCKLTHKVIPERMQDCSFFLQGLCTNENCPYRHVNVNPDAPVCEGFLRGYCADGNECHKKHRYVCPVFEATGICPQRSVCKLHHPKNQNKGKKRKRSKDQKSMRGRYFGSRLTDVAESSAVTSNTHTLQNNEDILFHEGGFADYISLDVSDEEAQETNDPTETHATLCDSDPSDLPSDDLDELTKPIRILNRNLTMKFFPTINSVL